MDKFNLSGLKKNEGEFLAWLTEGHVIPESVAPKSSSEIGRMFRVVSTEEIKQLIIKAMENNDELQANKLLDKASETQPLSKDSQEKPTILRKSIRVGNGEYLKLLYVKLQEKTSFSDIIIRMLIPHVRNYLSSLRVECADKLKDGGQRLDHLATLIDEWDKISPESRSRAVDLGLVDYDLGKYVEAYYPGKAEDTKSALSDFVLTELEKEAYPDHLVSSYPVFEAFRKRWGNQIREGNICDWVDLEVSITEDMNKIQFTPNVLLQTRMEEEERKKFCEDVGENNFNHFLKNIQRKTPGSKKTEDKHYASDDKDLHINRGVSLPTFMVSISGPKNFELECVSNSTILDQMKKDDGKLLDLIERLDKSIDLAAQDQFRKEIESRKNHIQEGEERVASQVIAKSPTLTKYVKRAVELSKTSSDFSIIKQINSLQSRIISYGTIIDFTEILVHNSIERRSIVSFHVYEDVWRFLPLVIKGKDWINIVDAYLNKSQSK